MARLDLYREGAFVRSLQLGASPCLVGRGDGCDLVLADPRASRRHFELRPDAEGYLLRDLDTVNGTDVNGVREYQCVLNSPAVLQVGEVILLFHPTGADEVAAGASVSLPQWAQDSLSAVEPPAGADPAADKEQLDGDVTGQLSPSDLKRLHSREMARTRPHLLLQTRGRTEVFPLDRRVNEVGLGRLQISLGETLGKHPRVLAEVRVEGDVFVVKARGAFSRIRISGRKVRSVPLRPGDVIELAGVELEFRQGLERPEDLREA